METAIPALSTMETWLVEGSSGWHPGREPAPAAGARFGQAHGALADEDAAPGQIVLVEQAADGDRHIVAVRHVLVAIGKGEPRRLAVEMDRFGGGAGWPCSLAPV